MAGAPFGGPCFGYTDDQLSKMCKTKGFRTQSYLEPEPADEEVEDHHGTRVEHPVGKVDGGAARHLSNDALQDEVGAGSGEGARAAGVGRVRHREEHHVAHVHLFLIHFRGGGVTGV